jgi:signal transduction histidine kinase
MDEAGKYLILIVDDENANLAVLNRILYPDYSIGAVKNGVQAMHYIKNTKPDLVLLDIMMPDMDGFEVLSEMKASPETEGIPVIFITGLSSADDEEKGFSLGAADYITKPFKSLAVKTRVATHLRNAQRINMELLEAKERAEKALVQAEYYNKAKSNFLSRMSHEMRTPLNAIMGMIGLVRNTEDSTRRNECLEKADESSRRLLEIINNVLDMAQLDTGKFTLKPNEFSLHEMIDKIFNIVSPRVKAKSQGFSIKISEDIPDLIFADEERLKEVLLHLISNAIKFTPEKGSISVSAQLAEDGEENCTLQFEVTDTGKGMGKEHLERLFSAFEQADNSITREYGGTGLGTALAKNIVELMGGQIRAESRLGQGSRFIFTVIVKKVKTGDGISAGEGGPLDLSGKHLLIVDDVDINREILLTLLEDSGAMLSSAENGAEAIRIFSERGCDLILMDIHMPDMDGIEASRQIRRIEEEHAESLCSKHVPIIAVSADAGSDVRRRCIDEGMNDHITKPVDFDVLFETVKKLVIGT